MIGVTLFGLFLTPVFYSVVRRFSDRQAVKPGLAHAAADVRNVDMQFSDHASHHQEEAIHE